MSAWIHTEPDLPRRTRTFALFALIPVFAFLVVLLIPAIVGLMLSFTDWDGIEPIVSLDFGLVGVDNYAAALDDEGFHRALALTIVYVIAVLVIANVLAFGLALLVTSRLRGKGFFRGVFFTPNLIAGVVLGFIWIFVFSQLMTYVGDSLGIDALRFSWLVDKDKAFIALIIVAVWQLSGYLMLIYIAGLVSIPGDVIEAATVDGASQWAQLLRIKIPLMVPAFTIAIFLSIRNAFLVFDTNLALTDGGPFRSTEMLTLHIYNDAFQFQNFDSAQAKAVLLFALVAVIAIAQVTFTKRYEQSA
jgi:raffinose/stachyose/melibiose transport system permease protein